MGEIAEMMLDGTLCQGCGVYIGHNGGYPTFCPSCARGSTSIASRFPQPSNPAKVACDVCGRHVKLVGLSQHKRDAHGSLGSGRSIVMSEGFAFFRWVSSLRFGGWSHIHGMDCPSCRREWQLLNAPSADARR